MKEEEAKKKWCPFASPGSTHRPNNRIYCLTSDCMVWKPAHRISSTGLVLEEITKEGTCGFSS